MNLIKSFYTMNCNMKNRLWALSLLLLAGSAASAQTLTPVAVTGYNHDVFAETFPNTLATTDTVLDGSSYVIYTQAFATAGAFGGGWPNNGAVADASNTRQFQLMSYAANNAMNVMRNDTRSFTLTNPTGFRKLSLLAFSTEGNSQVNIMLDFADGTTTTFANITIQDWFNAAANTVISGFGRVTRLAAATAVNGIPGSPNAYYIDLDLACADRKKVVQAIRIKNATTTGTNAPFPNAVFLGVAGQTDTQVTTSSGTNSFCGANNGTATVGVTGNSGPYSISWNTTPAQTTPTISNLGGGTYVASITDGNGCVVTRSIEVKQLVSPSSITVTASPASVCAGGSTQLSLTHVGGALANFTWTPGNITTTTFTATPTITTTYSVVGLDTAGCPFSRQVTVTVGQVPAAPVIPNIKVCGGGSTTIRIQDPQQAYVYNWYTTSTGGTPVFTGSNYFIANVPGNLTYYVSATNGACSSTRTAVTASLLPAAAVNAGPDKTIVAGETFQINATGTPGNYVWTPSAGLSSTAILNPMANPAVTTNYIITNTHPQGCVAMDTVLVTVLPYCVKITNAFTPNGDGVNDVWKIFDGNCIASAKVQVYNRYGSEVYESNDYKNNWNGTFKGKPLPDGTYYYVVIYKLVSGNGVYQKGNVTILR